MIWAVTPAGSKIPLDAEPVSRTLAGLRPTLYRVEPADAMLGEDKTARAVPLPQDAPEGHLSHFVTCEKRDQFRKGRR